MEMEFIVYKLVFRYENDCLYYMTRVTQGARQRHFILWLVFRVNVVNLKQSVPYESLVVSNSRNQTSPKPIIYVDIWIYDCWSAVNPITVHVPSLVSLASPRFRALQPTTNIEQPLLLTYINPD